MRLLRGQGDRRGWLGRVKWSIGDDPISIALIILAALIVISILDDAFNLFD